MGKNGYIPSRDAEFRNWGDNFAKQAGTHQADLFLTEAQVAELTSGSTEFANKYEAHLTAQDAAEAATMDKKKARKDYESKIRIIAGIIQANPEIPDSLRETMGLPVHDTTPSVVNPQTPQSLEAKGSDDGVNHLNWKAGENKTGTMYLIEAKVADSISYAMIDVVTKTKYDHKKQTPGVRVSYRVRAKRGEKLSEHSNIATVYDE
jgi:hypothetical protein